jgi:hypothetical protein
MSLEETLQDWKDKNNDPLGWWLSKLDKAQIKLMDEVKNQFNYRISAFREMKLEELRDEIDMHISYEAKKQLLLNRHAEVINKGLISRYRSIIKIINKDDYGLINDELYPEFIYSFGVIGLSSPWVFEENEIKATDYLDDINTVNIISRMLEVIEDEEKQKNTNVFNDKIYNDIEGQKFFKYVFDNWLKDEHHFYAVHCVIRLLWENDNYIDREKLGIRANAIDIMDHWNTLYAPQCKAKDDFMFNLQIKTPKIYTRDKIGKRWNAWEEKLNRFKDTFIGAKNLPKTSP